ncbi:MAG: hypothetical protein WAL80_26065, partial [Xanthobacteraceae bacterium]
TRARASAARVGGGKSQTYRPSDTSFPQQAKMMLTVGELGSDIAGPRAAASSAASETSKVSTASSFCSELPGMGFIAIIRSCAMAN